LSENECSHEVIVIGAGVAGLAAATEAARRGLQTALFDDGMLGGLITNVGELEGPPDHKGEAGADMVTAMLGEALEVAVDYQMGSVTELTATGDHWRVSGEDTLTAPRVILATGAQLRHLDVPGEAALMGRGVSQCAFCDGGLYRDKDVVVVGGGDAAFQEALHLAEVCANVTMVLRGQEPRARQSFVDRVSQHNNVTRRLGVEVREILGDDGVNAVRLYDQNAGNEETLTIDGIFPFVGLAPQTSLAPATAKRDENGGLIVGADMKTDQAGLYAIGAARSGYGGQVIHALEDARAAVN
jgi:thioredoxin reductase (NADPH)